MTLLAPWHKLTTPFFLAVLTLSVFFACEPTLAATVDPDSLCPVATKRLNRSVNYNNTPIHAATTAAELSDALAIVKTGSGEPRTFAILRLAMAGDLNVFRLLLANEDADGLYIYATRYLNRDDSVCLDPELESALLQGLNSPKLRHSLVGLLANNTYRNIEALHALRDISSKPTPGAAHKYLAFSRALAATHLPGVEADILEHARGFLHFDTPVEKRILHGLHQHYAEFFAEREYVPAISYLQELLALASRNEPVQNFQINYGMLRTVVHRALASIGGKEAYATLVLELTEISSKPLDAFAAAELQTLGKHLAASPQTGETANIVNAYQRILTSEQNPIYDYPMRRTIYPTLAVLNTAMSTALLIAELERYIVVDPLPNRAAIISQLFASLEHIQNLNMQPILALVDESTSVANRRQVWRLAAMHPSDGSVDFLLAQLRLAGSASTDTNHQLEADANKVLLRELASIDSSTQQQRVRIGIDDLFEQGALSESDYVDAASRLNKALGDESPRYIAFRTEQARQRAAEKQAQYTAGIAKARRESRAEYRAGLALHSSATGVAEDINAMIATNGRDRNAVQWLIIVGEPALAQLHDALTATTITDEVRFRIINVLGEIGSLDSIGPLIQTAQNSKEGGLYRAVFFSLALIPPTDETIAFARTQLDPGVANISERRQIAALVYLAQIRHGKAADLVARYGASNQSTKLRAAAIYLNALTGGKDAADVIEAALKTSADRTELETMLTSLAEVAASPEEFTRVAALASFMESSFNFRQDLAYCTFRTARRGSQKTELASKVLEDASVRQRRVAIRYLVEKDRVGVVDRLTGGASQYLSLDKLLLQSSNLQLLFSESRRMGYLLEQTAEGYRLIRA